MGTTRLPATPGVPLFASLDLLVSGRVMLSIIVAERSERASKTRPTLGSHPFRFRACIRRPASGGRRKAERAAWTASFSGTTAVRCAAERALNWLICIHQGPGTRDPSQSKYSAGCSAGQVHGHSAYADNPADRAVA
jgi:hypothetical protein